MGESIINKIFKDSFPISNKESWKQTATAELEGKEPFAQLSWNNEDGIKFLPYYTIEDVASVRYLDKFQHSPATNSFSGNRLWNNLPAISVTEVVTDNKTALNHLLNGADGILFNLHDDSSPDLHQLLSNIHWQYCFLSFAGVKHENFVTTLAEFLSLQDVDPSLLAGNIFWEQLPQKRNIGLLHEFKKINTLGCAITSSTPVKEIHDALVAGIQWLEPAEPSALEEMFKKISFSIPASANFLSTISKIKALRLLWYQVSQAYGLKDFSADSLHIHVRVERWLNDKFQPHGNMIHSTTAALASIIGGCNSLTIFPEDENNPTMNRIARNVSNILREESHLDKVADTVAGSYTLDIMVDSLAQHAWSLFQNSMKK